MLHSPPTIQETIAFIQKAHSGQVDKIGRPYWLHPLRVMESLSSPFDDEKHAALMHDVVEDTLYTFEDLLDMGYSKRTVEIVRVVTRIPNSGQTYLEWIYSIGATKNLSAIILKIEDIRDNLDPLRIIGLPPSNQQSLVSRYRNALFVLESALESIMGPKVRTQKVMLST